MTKNKKTKYSLLFLCVALISISIYFYGQRQNKTINEVSLFSWDQEVLSKENEVDLYKTMATLQVTQLYQEVSDENLYTDDVKRLLTKTNELGISVFFLKGKAEWGLDPKGEQLKLEIDKMVDYNNSQKGTGKFSGVLFDVEPYLTEEWDLDKEGTLRMFVMAMKEAYRYAQEKNVQMIICLPNWIDRISEKELEILIKECCDEVAIMNYNKKDEIVAIETEVQYAQVHKKPIYSIFEFQDVGKHKLTENETYANDGIEVALHNFDVLKEKLGYERIFLSYHYLNPIVNMLESMEVKER